jgi:hypothetical protein
MVDDRGIVVRFRAASIVFNSLRNFQPSSGVNTAPYSVGIGGSFRGSKMKGPLGLTTHFLLQPNLIMSGGIHLTLSPHMTPLRAQGDNFNLILRFKLGMHTRTNLPTELGSCCARSNDLCLRRKANLGFVRHALHLAVLGACCDGVAEETFPVPQRHDFSVLVLAECVADDAI